MKRTGILNATAALILLAGCSKNIGAEVDSAVATTANSSTAIMTTAGTTTEETTTTTTVGKVDFITTSGEATSIITTTSTANKVTMTSTTKTATTTTTVTAVATTTIPTAKTITNPVTTTIVTTTTASDTRPTVVWAEMNIPIYCNYDDPWEYPYDVETCLRDCKAYIEEKGLTWDDSLTLDNSTWAGNISSVPYAAWGGEPTFKSDVFARIDIEIQSWPTDGRYKVLFVPLNTPPFEGCYEVFVIHN